MHYFDRLTYRVAAAKVRALFPFFFSVVCESIARYCSITNLSAQVCCPEGTRISFKPSLSLLSTRLLILPQRA